MFSSRHFVFRSRWCRAHAEQLLLHVGFMETVKLHSIDFVAPIDGEDEIVTEKRENRGP